ncbi:MAG: TerD family protein, partial [Oscillospiraceae bacterium]|nr:TerD family protein [Oscillospiraceae bacterium]
FDLTECSTHVKSLLIGLFYRYKDTWKFNAVGSGVGRDLPAFCGMYGVNLE